MKTNRSSPKFIIALVMVLVSIGIYSYTYFDIYRKSDSVTTLGKSIADANTESERVKKMTTVIKDVEPYIEKAQKIVLPADGIVTLIESIENLEVQTGANVTILSINSPEHKDKIEKGAKIEFAPTVLSISANGSWTSIYKVLGLLENLPYQSSLNKVRLTRTGVGIFEQQINKPGLSGAISVSGSQSSSKLAGKTVVKSSAPQELWALVCELTVLSVK